MFKKRKLDYHQTLKAVHLMLEENGITLLKIKKRNCETRISYAVKVVLKHRAQNIVSVSASCGICQKATTDSSQRTAESTERTEHTQALCKTGKGERRRPAQDGRTTAKTGERDTEAK